MLNMACRWKIITEKSETQNMSTFRFKGAANDVILRASIRGECLFNYTSFLWAIY